MVKLSKIFGSLFSLVLFATSIWLYANKQDVIDWWRLKDYSPAPAIAQLASSASLNDEGRKLFYVHKPELLKKADFNGKCTTTEETIVLGCYISHSKIFVFDVDDLRLDGVEEVTAGHEMLHAVYDRLSDSEKQVLDEELLAVFKSLNNERLNSTIASYVARDPTVVGNELHSILGTEFRDLPEFLENHYAKYFVDRDAVVTLAEAYELEFTRRENLIKDFDNQLQALNTDIKQRETDLIFLAGSIEEESNLLNSLQSNPEAYNEALPSYNSKVRQYNNQLAELKSLIDQYNQIVEERNVIAVEEQELQQAIDSRITEL